MNDFKVNLEKKFKILKKRLIKNKAFIDVVLKIIATLATILLTFQANHILKQQNTINELEIERNFMEVAPAFSFLKNSDDEYTYFEMINSKGFISNVTFEKVDILLFHPTNYIEGPSNVSGPTNTIIDFSQWGIVSKEDSNSWIIREDAFNNAEDFANEVVEKINSSLELNEFNYSLNSYYHITYNDFQNIRKEEYYTVRYDGTGRYTNEYYLVEDFIEQPDNYLNKTEREFIFLEDEKQYNKIINIAVKEIQDYYNE